MANVKASYTYRAGDNTDDIVVDAIESGVQEEGSFPKLVDGLLYRCWAYEGDERAAKVKDAVKYLADKGIQLNGTDNAGKVFEDMLKVMEENEDALPGAKPPSGFITKADEATLKQMRDEVIETITEAINSKVRSSNSSSISSDDMMSAAEALKLNQEIINRVDTLMDASNDFDVTGENTLSLLVNLKQAAIAIKERAKLEADKNDKVVRAGLEAREKERQQRERIESIEREARRQVAQAEAQAEEERKRFEEFKAAEHKRMVELEQRIRDEYAARQRQESSYRSVEPQIVERKAPTSSTRMASSTASSVSSASKSVDASASLNNSGKSFTGSFMKIDSPATRQSNRERSSVSLTDFSGVGGTDAAVAAPATSSRSRIDSDAMLDMLIGSIDNNDGIDFEALLRGVANGSNDADVHTESERVVDTRVDDEYEPLVSPAASQLDEEDYSDEYVDSLFDDVPDLTVNASTRNKARDLSSFRDNAYGAPANVSRYHRRPRRRSTVDSFNHSSKLSIDMSNVNIDKPTHTSNVFDEARTNGFDDIDDQDFNIDWDNALGSIDELDDDYGLSDDVDNDYSTFDLDTDDEDYLQFGVLDKDDEINLDDDLSTSYSYLNAQDAAVGDFDDIVTGEFDAVGKSNEKDGLTFLSGAKSFTGAFGKVDKKSTKSKSSSSASTQARKKRGYLTNEGVNYRSDTL